MGEYESINKFNVWDEILLDDSYRKKNSPPVETAGLCDNGSD